MGKIQLVNSRFSKEVGVSLGNVNPRGDSYRCGHRSVRDKVEGCIRKITMLQISIDPFSLNLRFCL